MTIPDLQSCPDPEVLVLYLQGKLTTADRKTVGEHVKTCSECVFVLGETSRFLDEQEATVSEDPTSTAWSRSAWALAAAAVLVIAVGAATWQWLKSQDPVRRIAAAAASIPVTPVEGRLDGFPHATFELPRSNAKADRTATLRVVARSVVSDRSLGDVPSDLHARGVAELFLGNATAAAANLERAATASPSEPRYWSDLAAAQIEAARRDANPRLRLNAAIRAAERALALDDRHGPAFFNRAVARQALGDRRRAEADFRRAAALEPGSAWSAAAELRADRLAH